MMRIRGTCLALALSILAASRGAAQVCQVAGPAGTCSVSVTTSITIPAVFRLTVSGASTAVTVTEAVYDAGSATTAGPTITVKANQAWRVQISSTATFWSAANTAPGTPARTTKPISDLEWRNVTTGGAFAALSGTAAGLYATSQTATAGTSATLEFRTYWSYLLDTPGAYSVPVTITVFSP